MTENKPEFMKSGDILKLFPFSRKTLYNCGTRGDIKFILHNDTQRMYDIESVKQYLANKAARREEKIEETETRVSKRGICYTRIRLDDNPSILEHHFDHFRKKYPEYRIVYDMCDKFAGSNLTKELSNISKSQEIEHIVIYDKLILPEIMITYLIKAAEKYEISVTFL